MQNKLIIGVEANTKEFDKQVEYIKSRMEEIEYQLKKADIGYDVKDTQKLEAEYEKLSNKLGDLVRKKEEFNKTNFSKIKTQLNGVGNEIEGVIKKVTKWGLAIFGIRSAYSFVRSSISTLSQYNEQMATDIEYIRFALATAIQPIIEIIIKLVYTLLQYVNYLAQSLFGVNLFANASTKAFEKQNKAMKGTNKEAKELQKTLAGFDEMNVLQSNGQVTSGGGGGGTPSFNLSEIGSFDDIKGIETWLDKVAVAFNEAFDGIKNNVVKVMKNLGFSKDYISAFEFTIEGIKKIFNGLGNFIRGFGETIVGIFKGDNDLISLGFENMGKGVKVIFEGMLQTITGTFAQMLNIIIDVFKKIPEIIYELFIKKGNKSFDDFKRETENKFKSMINNIKNILVNIGTTAGNIIGTAFKNVINSVIRAIENILNTPIKAINGLIGIIKKVPGLGGLSKMPTFSLPRLAQGGIVNNPGNGVFMGSYVAGERGAEAVLPLTDEVFDRLGLAIGRHTSINATIPVYAYNRQVAREIRKIEASQSFAMNR